MLEEGLESLELELQMVLNHQVGWELTWVYWKSSQCSEAQTNLELSCPCCLSAEIKDMHHHSHIFKKVTFHSTAFLGGCYKYHCSQYCGIVYFKEINL